MVPPSAVQIVLTLALALFVGLEREEHKQQGVIYAFGGVRTFPLVALVSYALARMSEPGLLPWTMGFAVVGGFMGLSYYHKLSRDPPGGMTSEISALATYVVGGLAERDYLWLATTVGVVSVLLLELKKALEGLTARVASEELITVAKFLLLAGVILPIVPDRELTPFHINPFKTWLVVVAVSGVSFASYVLQRAFKERGGVMLAAALGGAYSSTMTTVVLARQAKGGGRPSLYAGGILAASGVMYVRLVLLLAFFSRPLAAEVAPAFAGLGVIGGVGGWLLSRRADATAAKPQQPSGTKNPLELRAAFLFALIFVVILILTSLAREYLGRAGVYSLAALMGVTDVDPFILGLAQGGPATTPVRLAAGAIVIAAASNNLVKAIYAYSFADRETGRKSLAALLALAALGLAPLAWI